MIPKERMAEYVKRIRADLRLLRLDCAVRVEGTKKTDEWFWSQTLSQIFPQKVFKIYRYSNLPTENSFGKQNVLQFKNFAASDYILCVDSDWDYLLENPDLKRPYIFQTYVYAVENYQCYAPNLINILRGGCDIEGDVFDFEDFMNNFSSAIHRLLVYSLFSMKTDGAFTAIECGEQISFEKIENLETDLASLMQSIDNQCLGFEKKYDKLSEFQFFKEKLIELGLTETNAYLFIRGHDLLENVVLKLLKYIAEPFIKTEFERRIKENGHQSASEYQTYLKKHKFENLLSNHFSFQENDFFQKIESDIRTSFQLIPPQ